jgi:beta-glucosidase-like glycosyl hydrolase
MMRPLLLSLVTRVLLGFGAVAIPTLVAVRAAAAAALLRGGDRPSPNYWGCIEEEARALQYCNRSLPIDERVQDLLSHLTLDEKIGAIAPDPTEGNVCDTHTRGVPRIGLPGYMWLVEDNTAVASACLDNRTCATQFSGPLSMGATFNRTAWYLKGSVLGTEHRALMNLNWMRFNHNTTEYLGFTAFGPNINQPRDPRFGRTSELPGEDPYLSGQYALHMVRGMQQRDKFGYPKVFAYLKHFAAYSRETGRGHDTHNITIHDLYDTYLPAFEAGMEEAAGVMCSYNGINGVPSCANSYLLNDVLRKQWNRPMAHVTTDCGAVSNLLGPPAGATDGPTAAAWALMNGSDIEMGSMIWSEHLAEAVARGLASEAAVDQAFLRSYRPHFEIGRFDDPEASEWSKLGYEDVGNDLHKQIQLETALQGIVLLKNENSVLPLEFGMDVAVIGPLGETREGLMSDYEADQSCYDGTHDCIKSLAENIRAVNDGGQTTDARGVDIDSDYMGDISDALKLAEQASVVVLCLGITKAQEREGVDRIDTALPGKQEYLAQEIVKLNRPVVLVVVNGGQVALDNLVDHVQAIIEIFNPNSIGGRALAQSLFGMSNRWGKLPYTIYSYDAMQSFDMADYSMSKAPGRTHRYFTGQTLFPFGYGLSYSTFAISCFADEAQSSDLNFVCQVWNTGSRTGDEVIQVYAVAGNDIREKANHPVPIKSLVDFERVQVPMGETASVRFDLDSSIFKLVDENGDRRLYTGTYKLLFTNGVIKPIVFHKIVDNNGTEKHLLSADQEISQT